MSQKVGVMPLYVYGIWHKPDERWVFGPCVATIFKSKMLSEDASGCQTWRYNFCFVSLSTGFVQHRTKGTDNRDFDSRKSIFCQDVDPPTKDWGNRSIPWQDCEWVTLGSVVGAIDAHRFDWDKYRFYGGKDNQAVKGKPSWWNSTSRGTKHSIDLAEDAGKPVYKYWPPEPDITEGVGI